MSQAMIRGMVDEDNDQFVAYFLPVSRILMYFEITNYFGGIEKFVPRKFISFRFYYQLRQFCIKIKYSSQLVALNIFILDRKHVRKARER